MLVGVRTALRNRASRASRLARGENPAHLGHRSQHASFEALAEYDLLTMVARQHDDPVGWADPISVLHEETEHADEQNVRLLEAVSSRLLFHRHARAIDLQQVIAASDQPKQLRAERGRADDGIVGGDDVAVPKAEPPQRTRLQRTRRKYTAAINTRKATRSSALMAAV